MPSVEYAGFYPFITCVAIAIMGWIMWRQQRTIDRLTDKLMAKDYGEYKRHDKPVMREEPRIRKPQSYYDDTSVEVDDDKLQ